MITNQITPSKQLIFMLANEADRARTVTSFSLEIAGSLVPASPVASLEDEEPAEAAVARSVEFGPKHSCEILELYAGY